MAANRLWNRLASPAPEDASAPGPVARPCIPAVEALDDRILLSVTIGEEQEQNGVAGILIGLIKGEFDLLKNQLAVLNLVGDDTVVHKNPADYLKLSDGFLKIDTILSKFAQDLLKIHTSPIEEVQKVTVALENEFAKIDAIVQDFGGDVQKLLLPAVQQTQQTVSRIVSELAAQELTDISHKTSQTLIKIVSDFHRIDQLLYKFGETLYGADLLGNKHLPAASKILSDLNKIEIKIDSLLGGLGDENLYKLLLPAVQQVHADTLQFFGSLTSAGDGFIGGVDSPLITGDVISGDDPAVL